MNVLKYNAAFDGYDCQNVRACVIITVRETRRICKKVSRLNNRITINCAKRADLRRD